MSQDVIRFIIFTTRGQHFIEAMDFYGALEEANDNHILWGDLLGVIKVSE